MENNKESGKKSSDGKTGYSNKASPAAIEKYLKGIHFPLHKKDILKQAKENHAPNDIISVLEMFEDKEYSSVTDIAKQVGSV